MTTQTQTSVRIGVIPNLIKTTIGDKECWATPEQVKTLKVLDQTVKGGFATVHGYKPTSGYIKSPTVNINFISRFSTEKLYARKMNALKDLKFSDLSITSPKLVELTETEQQTLFHSCVSAMLESMQKTLDGDRSDNHRQAHDTFYGKSSTGVKVHFQTSKVGRETHLDLIDGLPVVDSIMLSVIEIGRKVVEEGEHKIVNSGPKVLMDNAINKAIKGKTISMKTISLKSDNHTDVSIGGEVLEPEVALQVQEVV